MALIVLLSVGGSTTDRDGAKLSSNHQGNDFAADSPHPGPTPGNVYAGTAPGDLSAAVKRDRPLVYVPNSLSNTVDIISQRTLKVIGQFPTGLSPSTSLPPGT